VRQPRFIGSAQVSALGLGGASWSFADYAPWVEATPHPVDDDLAGRRAVFAMKVPANGQERKRQALL
jgi:hypothetical protein